MVPEVIFDENVVSGRFPAFCHTLGEVCTDILMSPLTATYEVKINKGHGFHNPYNPD